MAVNQLSDGRDEGACLGQSSADLVGFYGATPVARPSVLTAMVDSSGGTASYATGIVTLTGTYNSAILGNAIATLAAGYAAIKSKLETLGLTASS
jgi:hypothetical protein